MGSIFVPASLLESHVGTYCLNLFVVAHDDIFRISLVGSAIPIKFGNKFFLVCSRHQLVGVDPQDVCILFPDGTKSVTNSGFRGFDVAGSENESDATDIVAFDFTEPLEDFPNLKSAFLSFGKAPPDIRSDKVVALISVGFPSCDQIYELEESNHIGLVKRIMTSKPDGQPTDQCLQRARYYKQLDFAPDGLSGGPVFVVWMDGSEAVCLLAGMILRSGDEMFHFLKSGMILEFLGVVTDKGSI